MSSALRGGDDIVDDDDDNGPADGPAVLGYVKLARKPGTLHQHICILSQTYRSFSYTARGYPRYLPALEQHLQYTELHELVRRFLYDRLFPNTRASGATVPLDHCPQFEGPVSVFHSAVAVYHAPSDPCGTNACTKSGFVLQRGARWSFPL